MIYVVFLFKLFNLMRISFNAKTICFFTMSVNDKTFTHWKRNSVLNASISLNDLSRSKMMISLIKCSLRLFKKNFFKAVCIFVSSSRRSMSDDMTSICTKHFASMFKARITIISSDKYIYKVIVVFKTILIQKFAIS